MNHAHRFNGWGTFAGHIGIARRDITPPVGIYSGAWGCAKHDVVDGVHQPMLATVISLRDAQGQRVVLASLDLGWWSSANGELMYHDDFLQAAGVPESHLILHCIHTHAGPRMSLDRVNEPGGDRLSPYFDLVRTQLIHAIEHAIAAEEPAILDWTQTTCALACRRVQRDAVTGQSIVGHDPQRDADDTVLVGRVTCRATGQVRGVLVNYACHPTTLGADNTVLSPDYPGQMRATIEAAMPGVTTMFLQGASGELAPWRQYSGDVRIAENHGRALGYAALSALNLMLPAHQKQIFDRTVTSGADLGYWKLVDRDLPDTLRVQRITQPLTRRPCPTQEEIRQRMAAATDPVQLERLKRELTHRIAFDKADKPFDGLHAWVWQLGDAHFVGTPAEAYNAFQQALRQSQPHRPVAVMNIANGYASYLPSQALTAEDAYTARVGFFEVGSLEMLTESCVTAMQVMA